MIFFILFLLFIIILNTYNKLVQLKNKIKQSKSGIDVYLTQRFDLIPNLVECVKAYSKHESSIFKNINNLRSLYDQTKDFEKANQLNNRLYKILAIAENYPNLKTSNQFLNLQKNLVKIESQLQAARRIYNNDVTIYNTKIETFPINLVALLFGFRQAELFQIEEYKKENPTIKIKE